jgi:hypothetical protein
MDGDRIHLTPAGLNTTVATLFVVGSACFVLGSVPAYADAVGATPVGVTFVVGSVFFTSASFGQLIQAQTPALAEAAPGLQHRPARPRWWAWLPKDHAWLSAAAQFPGTLFFNVSTAAALVQDATVHQQDQHVWRPDIYGSTLFLVSSGFGVAAAAGAPSGDRIPRVIGWLNLVGSVFFMVAALASYILPGGDELDDNVAVAGTLLGAACFLIAAALMVPAWDHAVRRSALSGETL